MPLKTKPFDTSRHIEAAEAEAELLADAIANGHAGYIAGALDAIARARGMSNVAREAGVTRDELYEALGNEGDAKLVTLLEIAKALGVRLTASLISEK